MRNQKIAIIVLIVGGIFLLLLSYVSQAQTHFSGKEKSKPNIVWITCEDMSPHLSCYGESQITTPNIDALAKEGVRYTNVFTVAGVCAPSRNAIITGMYPQSIGGNNMRNYQPAKRGQEESVTGILSSYSIVPPAYVRCFPEYLRKEGYYCTNNPKEDYQFEAPVTVWDQSDNKAHWRNRPPNKPFFAVFNLAVTHESQLWMRDSIPLEVNPEKVIVPPYYPDNSETRNTIARHLSNIKEMDRQAGRIIQELKDSGLYNNTIIFFYSDHGDALPYVKREITKRGLHIPLIIKFPNKIRAGETDSQLISSIDFGPTVLSLADVEVPKYLHGRAFLGNQKKNERKYIFAARDRMDAEVDRVRTVFDGRYQYIRNYMPEKPWYQNILYRLQIPMMRKMLELKEQGQLNAVQARWFEAKPLEELYDTKSDPYQLNNIIGNIEMQNKLKELKGEFNKWMNKIGDQHELPELELRNKMWGNETKQPFTAEPELINNNGHFQIKCKTEGVSIGYKLLPDSKDVKGDISWRIYTDPFSIPKGYSIIIRAQRIGYKASEKMVKSTELK